MDVDNEEEFRSNVEVLREIRDNPEEESAVRLRAATELAKMLGLQRKAQELKEDKPKPTAGASAALARVAGGLVRKNAENFTLGKARGAEEGNTLAPEEPSPQNPSGATSRSCEKFAPERTTIELCSGASVQAPQPRVTSPKPRTPSFPPAASSDPATGRDALADGLADFFGS